ncbi:phosphotransferase family protein [uncultured Mycolicibacterium sp.]|uniref:phosphotransferase family protein n=1 Tax=uncultured Mycolicibacterium sp. TaxID=2320817 RepID=UPI00261AC335|nr:phosphotransferase family protein [uncultured Mycolicibacterium sp.]
MADRPAPDELPALLEPVLRERIPGAQRARVTDWRGAERGLSTETYLFTLADEDGTPLRQLVFRRPPAVSLYADYDLARQVLVMNRLAGTEVPVPTVCWLDRDGGPVGTPYYVMEQVPNVGTVGDFPSYHVAGLYHDATPRQREAMWWGCVAAMAAVHRLDWRSLRLEKLLLPEHGSHPLEQIVNYYAAALDWATDGTPRPELAAAVDWLRTHCYEVEDPVLCWGDARLSNVLYGPDQRMAAVLDWEIAYIGDHAADLAWLLFLDWAVSDYEGTPRLPGTPSREETIRRYEQLSGRPVTHLHYQEVLAVLALSVPLSRMDARLRSEGLIADGFDVLGFCVARVRELLGG